MLNRLWTGFFLISFLSCIYQAVFLHHPEAFNDVITALFAMAKTSVDISLGLVGVMCLWLGIFRIAEESRLIDILSKGLAPLLSRLMPEVPSGHPAMSAMTMNLAANMIGLDNAATPLGIKAMQALQTLNPSATIASNAQIVFLVLNTSSVTLLPVTIFMFRAQAGAASATDVFLPILLSTCCGTLAGLLAVSAVQKIKLFQPVILAYLFGFAAFMTALMLGASSIDASQLSNYSSFTANVILLGFIVGVISYAAYKRLPSYDLFIEGAKDGFNTAIGIIPYLIAMLLAIAALRSSGVFDLVINSVSFLTQSVGLPSDFVAALPTGLMKSFSGSGARALMLESFSNYGVDSLIGRMTSVMQGSSETTFYVLAVYFGSVGIRNGRHAVACGLIADVTSIVAAIIFTTVFFG